MVNTCCIKLPHRRACLSGRRRLLTGLPGQMQLRWCRPLFVILRWISGTPQEDSAGLFISISSMTQTYLGGWQAPESTSSTLARCRRIEKLNGSGAGSSRSRLFTVLVGIALCFTVWWPARAASTIDPSLLAWHQRLAQSSFSGTVLIARSGAVLYHRSFGASDRARQRPIDEHTVFDIGSLTKQFTATAVMLLVERGQLSLDAQLGSLLTDVPADKKAITVHQLLCHASGLPAGLPGRGLYDRVEARQLSAEILAQRLIAAPGERYHYSNIGYSLLAQIIEQTSGEEWETFIRQNILLPAGLSETGYRLLTASQARLAVNYGADQNWLQRRLGLKAASRSVGDSLQHLRQAPGRRWFEGAGGFMSTAQDMFAWSQAMSSGRILRKSSWAQMLRPHITENAEKAAHYGYGWLLSQTPSSGTRVSHDGSNGYSYATFDHYPDLQLFIFTASNDIDHYPYEVMKALHQLLLTSGP